MRMHDEFEWDEDKAASNASKHRVTFEDAAYVLQDDEGDVYHLDEPDDSNSVGEDRYLTTASHPDDRRIVLVISWTDRSTDDRQITRIISARPATPEERKRYAQEISVD